MKSEDISLLHRPTNDVAPRPALKAGTQYEVTESFSPRSKYHFLAQTPFEEHVCLARCSQPLVASRSRQNLSSLSSAEKTSLYSGCTQCRLLPQPESQNISEDVILCRGSQYPPFLRMRPANALYRLLEHVLRAVTAPTERRIKEMNR